MVYVRDLLLDNVNNIRELGGYSTIYKGSTSFKEFIRSGVLTNLAIEEIEYLLEYGITTVIDLREKNEILLRPNSFSNVNSVKYYNIPVLSDTVELSCIPTTFLDDDCSSYVNILNNGQKMRLVFNAIANNIEGVILFNSELGRDRAGVIAALLLMLADVSTNDIIIDYSISFTTINKLIRPDNVDNYDMPRQLLKINQVVNYINVKYGSIVDYFIDIGMSIDNIGKIKNKLLVTE